MVALSWPALVPGLASRDPTPRLASQTWRQRPSPFYRPSTSHGVFVCTCRETCCCAGRQGHVQCMRRSAWSAPCRASAWAIDHSARHAAGCLVHARRSISRRAGTQGVTADQADFPYDHILIALTDSHRALTSTSRQTMELAVGLASPRRSKLTVMFIEERGSMPPTDCIASIRSEFAGRLLGELSFVEEAVGYAEGRGAVALGEVADTLSADLVVLSTQAVRQHCLDANLLAEFVPCPLLLLP